MRTFVRLRDFDARAWRTATVSAPFVVQGVLGLLFVNIWLLGKWPFPTHSAYGGECTLALTATVTTAVESLLIGAPTSGGRGRSSLGRTLRPWSCAGSGC